MGRSLNGFIAYVIAKIETFAEEKIFMNYIADSVMTMANNTARFAGGMTVTMRYSDMIEPQETKEDIKADDIILKVINNAGLEVKTS